MMLGVFGKWPPSWKMFSTIYQYSKWVHAWQGLNMQILENFTFPLFKFILITSSPPNAIHAFISLNL